MQSLLLNVVMHDCDEMITIKSLDLRYLDCNNAFMQHIGAKSKEDVIGKPIIDVIPMSNYKIIKENVDKILKTGKLQSYSFEIETNNSLRIVQQISTPVIKENQIKYILTISRDITQDELLKEKLAAKTVQLDTLMEYLPLLVYMKDNNKNYIIGSKYAKNFVENGIDPYADNVQINMDKSLYDTMAEDDFVLNNKEKLRKEKTCFDSEGNQHWYRVLKAPILKEDNSIDGLVTIAKNIDNEKAVENQKDLFIATLVHDLKNPLLAQISGMELLAKGYFSSLTPEQKEMLETIIESANYMKEMLYTLINTYKYDNGNIILKKSKTDLDAIIKTCIREHQSLAKENRVTISYTSTLQEEDKYIMIDEKQIRRVITNLLNNGINYAFKDTEFLIKTYLRDDRIIIKLTNSGPPIDEETKAHLFEKYISGSNKYQKIGFGLGMYLSKKVIEAHEGEIYYTGEDTTNTFVIELPRQVKNSINSIKW
ncbi:MAG: ATP-binding protein [Candidatus Gastranaerophilaceae bacterium]